MKRTLLTIAALLSSTMTWAQSTEELFRFSQYDAASSTARSAAMAGAFTSLGADLSSMSINPAGLAMYSRGEVSLTLGAHVGTSLTNYSGKNSSYRSDFRVTVPNLAAAFKIGDFTLAVGYNRLANFGGQMQSTGNYEQFNSMARIWVDQLRGIPQSELDNADKMFNRPPILWNAVMGFDTYLVDPATELPKESSYGLWGIINPSDYIASTIDIVTNGGIDEAAISGAWNKDDIFYFGATLGFQRIYFTQQSVYREFNDLNNPNISGLFNDMSLSQNLVQDGFGFNIKVGATVRPVSWLRVGVAYHSPTWSSMREVSNSDMASFFDDDTDFNSYSPDLIQDYNFQSPARLLAGISFTIAKRVIISGDFQRTWNREMFYNTKINEFGWRQNVLSSDIDNLPNYGSHTSSRGNIAINDMVVENFRSSNTYRLGIEAQPVDGVFLRAGVSHSESPYAVKESLYEPGAKLNDFGAVTRYSGGVGYQTNRFKIDLAYVYGESKALPSKFFDYITIHPYNDGLGGETPAGTNLISQGTIQRKVVNHQVNLTFAWKF